MFLAAALISMAACADAYAEWMPRGFGLGMYSDCHDTTCKAETPTPGMADTNAVVVAMVENVDCNSPAGKAGLRDGDIIVAINGIVLKGMNSDAAWDVASEIESDNPTILKIVRNEADRQVEITIQFTAAWYESRACQDA